MMIYNINMKKLLTLLLILLMVFTLVGCNSKEETPAAQELEQQEVIEKIEEKTEIAGGYVDVEDGTLTDELKDIFSKALEDLTGAKYEPVELVATQVVAGTNYKFLANGTKTTNPITKGTYFITIYKDLQGNVKLLDIETTEEEQEKIIEETKEEVDPEVLKTYKYWVVFYNPDGTELQREALKWGTTPEYYDGIPYYYDGSYDYDFVGWTNKQGKPKELKPITGNSYFYANYEISTGRNSGGGSNPSAPLPDHTLVECLTSTGGAGGSYINSLVTCSSNMRFVFDSKMVKTAFSRPFGYYGGGAMMKGMLIQTNGSGFEYYRGSGYSSGTYGADTNVRISYDIQFNGSSSYIKINGGTWKTFACQALDAYEVTLFSLNGRVLQDASDQALSMYSMQIYKDDVLERDFVPVKINKELDASKNATDPTANIPAGTLCFYDNVTEKYYLNSGGGSFTDIPIN